MKVKNLRKVVKVRKAIWDDSPSLTNCTVYCASIVIITIVGLSLLTL